MDIYIWSQIATNPYISLAIVTVALVLLTVKLYPSLTHKHAEGKQQSNKNISAAKVVTVATTNEQLLRSESPPTEQTDLNEEECMQTMLPEDCVLAESEVTADSEVEEKKVTKLSVKQKFYLFLEKGFCPELEDGVKDPMYKYAGGAIRNSKSDWLKPAEGFCPFQGFVAGDTPDSEDYGAMLTEDENMMCADDDKSDYKEQMEGVMKQAIEKTGKCPFSTMRNETERQSCPFDFGMKADVDSEEEADMPRDHGRDGQCPAMFHKEGSSQAPNNNQIKGDPAPTDISGSTNNSAKTTLKRLESSLTKEEREEEASTRLEQMAAIMKILHEQETKVGVVNESDLKRQLEMYM